MTTIGFHSTKGGVGTTLLATHACALAKDLGVRVTGLTFDRTRELQKRLDPLGIPCVDGFKVEALPDDVDLIVVDWNTQVHAVPLELDLLVIPIDCNLSVGHALDLSDRLSGRILWLENHPHDRLLSTIALPSYLDHVEVLAGFHGVARSRAIHEASEKMRTVWSTEDGARSPGGRNLRSALMTVLRKAGVEAATDRETAPAPHVTGASRPSETDALEVATETSAT